MLCGVLEQNGPLAQAGSEDDMSRQRDELGRDLALLGFAAEVPFKGLSGTRRWRWDWAIDERRCEDIGLDSLLCRQVRLAVEYQGIIGAAHGHGDVGHASIAGMLRDHEKASEGQLCGWIVLLVNAKTVDNGKAMEWVRTALGEGEQGE